MRIDKFISRKPYIISGPCSAESEDQLRLIARFVAKSTDLFRAGIWKPRTHPNSFEGVGEQALLWMQNIKKETGLRVMTEVANARHVDLCLEKGIDLPHN